MAGQFRRVIYTLGAVLLTSSLFAEPPAGTAIQETFTPKALRSGVGGADSGGNGQNAPELENARRALEALTPEQRKRFKDNVLRWMELSPEEQRILREREEWRRERMAQEVEHAIKMSGLVLDPQHREMFAKRYHEERRLLEEELRRDTEARRKPAVQEIIKRLRLEFSGNAPAIPPPTTPFPGPALPSTPPVNVIPPLGR